VQPGEHRIRAAMGSVRLDLARGMDLCIEAHTALGSVRNNYPVRADAPRRLVLSTEMGSVRVDQGPVMRPPSPAKKAPGAPDAPDAANAAGSVPAEPARAEARRQPDMSRSPREDPELERILKMVEAGELSAKDADELLQAMGRV
jgi:hypothetical protein